ncbi:MAG: phosphopantetheine-binding protein [Nitrospiraceae bacterium]|nr:phosphopantetheine-binding protein [Nitrospiraceae bacterium]
MVITLNQLREKMKEIDWEVDSDTLDEASPLRDQGLDSLDMVTLFFFIEETFSVKISDSDSTHLASLRDIAEYLKSR